MSRLRRSVSVPLVFVLIVAGVGATARSVFGSDAVGAVMGGGAAGTCTPSWRIVASGSKAPSLSAVDVLSPRDVWGVGGAKKPVIVHWDGKSLRSQPSSVALSAVAAVSAKDVWAVGPGPVAVHWNGRRWRRVALPRVTGGEGDLSGVVALSSRDVWAVGSQGASRVRPLVMHWDGTGWRIVETPQLEMGPFGALYAVDAVSTGDVWAVGVQTPNPYELSLADLSPLVLRWSRNAWNQSLSLSPLPNSSVDAVDARSARDVWAIITDWSSADSGVGHGVVRWDGRPTVFRSPGGPGGLESDIAALAPDDAWVVGFRYASSSPDRPLVAHWDGHAWRVQTTPMDHLKGATLRSIDALSATEIWAVGDHLAARYACRQR